MKTAKVQPKKTAKQVVDEWDLSNVVSVDITKHILWEHELMRSISVKKPALNKNIWKSYELSDCRCLDKEQTFSNETRIELYYKVRLLSDNLQENKMTHIA